MPKRRNQDPPRSPHYQANVLYTHGTITSTILTQRPPLLRQIGRDAADHQGGFLLRSTRPTTPASSRTPASSSRAAARSTPALSNHGRPLRAHAGALQVLVHSASITHPSFPPFHPASPFALSPFHEFFRKQHVPPLVPIEGEGRRPALPALQDLPGPETRHGLQAGTERRRVLRRRLRNEKGT